MRVSRRASLKQIASVTQAEYFYAGTAAFEEGLVGNWLVFSRKTEIRVVVCRGRCAVCILACSHALVWTNNVRHVSAGERVEHRG